MGPGYPLLGNAKCPWTRESLMDGQSFMNPISNACVTMVIPICWTMGPLLSQRLPLASAKAEPWLDFEPILKKCLYQYPVYFECKSGPNDYPLASPP